MSGERQEDCLVGGSTENKPTIFLAPTAASEEHCGVLYATYSTRIIYDYMKSTQFSPGGSV